MRVLLIPVALVLVGGACADESLIAPVRASDEVIRATAAARSVEAPEVTAALALIDSVMAQSTELPLVIVDGIIQQTTLAEVPRAQIIRAELVRATSCVLSGPGREFTVVMVSTRAAASRAAR